MKVASAVVRSGLNREYNVCRSAEDAVALGEICRRHNDGQIPLSQYPIQWDGLELFNKPKNPHKANSWKYTIRYRLSAESDYRVRDFEGVCQRHLTGAFIVWITKAMYLGEIPGDLYYEIAEINRKMHRVTIQPTDL